MARQFLGLALILVLGVAVHQTIADEPERVFGGTDAIRGEFPYQIALRYVSGGQFCGGTLITTGHVVTAAHCVHNARAEDLVVATGSVDVNGGEEHRVKLIRVHPKFNINEHAQLADDIAVLTLADPVVENQYQKAIPFASYEPPHGTPLMLTGWGLMNLEGKSPKTLQKATLYIQSQDKCNEKMNRQLHDNQVCALNSRGIGACMGDSGGPLVHDNQLVGIVSWGIPCALNIPDVFTKASKYYDFVKESILLSYEQ